MLQYLKGYTEQLEVNGKLYDNVELAIQDLKDYQGQLHVKLIKTQHKGSTAHTRATATASTPATTAPKADDTVYKIKVRRYMTKPATPEFDFHAKWNAGKPMPMRVMVGKVLQETKGMVKMELWGEITEEVTQVCMMCGKPLTNPVSKFFGVGPECGGHNYVNPFETEEELKNAVASMQAKLKEMRWTGWIIKSAIEEQEVLRKS